MRGLLCQRIVHTGGRFVQKENLTNSQLVRLHNFTGDDYDYAVFQRLRQQDSSLVTSYLYIWIHCKCDSLFIPNGQPYILRSGVCIEQASKYNFQFILAGE